MNYSYSSEYDERGNLLKDISIDEYGNEEIEYSIDDDEYINSFSFSDMVRKFISEFKLQLTINKSLYEEDKISKELYEKIEILILERIEYFEKNIKSF